jgi:hypothetical protein
MMTTMMDEEMDELDVLRGLLPALMGGQAKQQNRIEEQAKEIQDLLAENEALSLRLFRYEKASDVD